jgi:predicted DNA binding CopG/RHH family protein
MRPIQGVANAEARKLRRHIARHGARDAKRVRAQSFSDDFSGFRLTTFEFEPKTKSVTMRLPESLLDAVRARAEKQGMPYQKLIRIAIERLVAQQTSSDRSSRPLNTPKGKD